MNINEYRCRKENTSWMRLITWSDRRCDTRINSFFISNEEHKFAKKDTYNNWFNTTVFTVPLVHYYSHSFVLRTRDESFFFLQTTLTVYKGIIMGVRGARLPTANNASCSTTSGFQSADLRCRCRCTASHWFRYKQRMYMYAVMPSWR